MCGDESILGIERLCWGVCGSHFERESSRYCPNQREHGHFHDSRTGVIHDVDFKPGTNLADVLVLPPGAVIEDVEITLRGKLAAS